MSPSYQKQILAFCKGSDAKKARAIMRKLHPNGVWLSKLDKRQFKTLINKLNKKFG